MSNHRAVAVDGWRVSEMKPLPISLFSLVAELFQEIEQGSEWPQLNCHACISCLPKSSFDATKFDSTTISAPSACDTRPISNISPWATTYSRLRFKQMSKKSWLPASMHGARKNQETSDVSLELQLFLDHSRVTQKHVAGFDLPPYDVCLNVLAALVASPTVIAAERRFYQKFQCFYNANGAISPKITQRSNGFIQGCSFSLQAALGILSAWTKFIESTPTTY